MFGQDGWILASFLFCEFMDLDSVSVHKHTKKEVGEYPAIVTSLLVNNLHLQHGKQHHMKVQYCSMAQFHFNGHTLRFHPQT